MCCFAREVQDVSDTQIFARMSEAGKQFLVYRMRYQSKTLNAMILPLPVALPSSEDHVRFIALDKYEHFFDDLNRGFPYPPPPKSVAPPAPSRAADEAPTLKVEEVGEYVASFVPTLNDFGRLDPQFVIPKETWKKLPEYDDYGFAVFQLKSLSGRPHPMAFEFQTRWADQVFFPTVHIHDGEVHETEHFDHTLYLQNAAWDSVVRPFANPEYRDPTTGFVRSKG